MPIGSEVLINAPPRIVRQIFLDFPNLKKWHDASFYKEMKMSDPNKKGIDAVPGDGVECLFMSGWLKHTVQTNTPETFRHGKGMIAFEVHFKPDGENQERTRFLHQEVFTGRMGAVADFIGGWLPDRSKSVGRDLKVAAEKEWANAK